MPKQKSTTEQRLAIYWKTADTDAIIKRFWSCVDKTPGQGRDGDCWKWLGDFHPHYGTALFVVGYLSGKRIRVRAARWIHEQIKGPLGDLYVCHSCDWPLCVRPDHLEAGNQDKNMGDAGKRNRMPLGERHHNCKIPTSAIESIRNDPRTQEEIAADYGVSRRTIGKIKDGTSRIKLVTPSGAIVITTP